MKMTDDPEMHRALAEADYAPLPEYVESRPDDTVDQGLFPPKRQTRNSFMVGTFIGILITAISLVGAIGIIAGALAK